VIMPCMGCFLGSGQKGVFRMKTTEVGSFSPNAFATWEWFVHAWEIV
jgi:hypothetical protein